MQVCLNRKNLFLASQQTLLSALPNLIRSKENRFVKSSLWKTVGICTFALLLSSCFSSEKRIVGLIDIQPELKAKIGPNAVLYVIGRSVPETESGATTQEDTENSSSPKMILAVRRFIQPFVFPIEFQLNRHDTMMDEKGQFTGTFLLSARIAQSGSATPIRKGDIQGKAVPNEVDVESAEKPKILLDEVLDQDFPFGAH